jgi:hypothetical protein
MSLDSCLSRGAMQVVIFRRADELLELRKHRRTFQCTRLQELIHVFRCPDISTMTRELLLIMRGNGNAGMMQIMIASVEHQALYPGQSRS